MPENKSKYLNRVMQKKPDIKIPGMPNDAIELSPGTGLLVFDDTACLIIQDDNGNYAVTGKFLNTGEKTDSPHMPFTQFQITGIRTSNFVDQLESADCDFYDIAVSFIVDFLTEINRLSRPEHIVVENEDAGTKSIYLCLKDNPDVIYEYTLKEPDDIRHRPTISMATRDRASIESLYGNTNQITTSDPYAIALVRTLDAAIEFAKPEDTAS